MSLEICKAQVFGFRNQQGRRIPDFIIKNNYDGRFLEWRDVSQTGIKEVDENIGCDGSVVVHKKLMRKRSLRSWSFKKWANSITIRTGHFENWST
jgi:hypothetical protein